jgi:hypothetical protein
MQKEVSTGSLACDFLGPVSKMMLQNDVAK